MKRKFSKLYAFVVVICIISAMILPASAETPTSAVGDNVVRVSARGAMSIVVEMLGANLASTSQVCLNNTSMPQLLPTFAVNNVSPDPYLKNFVDEKMPQTSVGWTGAGPGDPVYDSTASPPTSPLIDNAPDIIGISNAAGTPMPTLEFLQSVSDAMEYHATLLTPATVRLTTEAEIKQAVLSYAECIERVMEQSGKTTRYNDPVEIANAFGEYYDSVVSRVQTLVSGADLTDVLYVTGSGSGVYTVISESADDIFGTYGITVAGGKNVGVGTQMTSTQIRSADPDVIVSRSAALTSTIKADSSLNGISAIDSGRVYTIPTGAYGWSLRSPESCLAPLWLAKTLHPDKTSSLNLYAEVYSFYQNFYHYDTSASAAQSLDDVVAAVTGLSSPASSGGCSSDSSTFGMAGSSGPAGSAAQDISSVSRNPAPVVIVIIIVAAAAVLAILIIRRKKDTR